MSAETDKLVGAAASQALPGLFKQGFQKKYPGFITTQGRGNGYYNAMYEMEQRQFTDARMAATAADAEQASRTIVGMFMTAASLSGKKLSDEQIVKIQEAARFHGANIETYCGMARMMGLNEGAINYIRQAFYGDKGSTAHMFDTSYNVLKSRIGHGAALRQSQQLANYQFGAGWNRSMTGNLNADEFAATQQFLIENGGMAGSDLASSQGYAMIDTRNIASYRSRAENRNKSVDDLVTGGYEERFVNGPEAHRNQQALKMATNNYINELKKMNYAQLRRAMKGSVSSSVDNTWDKLQTLDEQMGKIKEGYRLKIDTNEKDLSKAKAELQKQLNENIKKAKEAKDDEAVKELETYGKKIVDNLDDLYKTGVKNAKGEEVSAFELDTQARGKVAKIAEEQVHAINKRYDELDTKLDAYKSRRAVLISEGKGDTEDVRNLNAEIKKAERERAELRDLGPAAKHAKSLRGNSDKEQRIEAIGNVAKSIQAAMAASGKPIKVEEALQASKALMPMNANTEQLRAIEEHLSAKLSGVIDRNGSTEQFLLQMSSGRNIAAQYGLRGVEANLAAGLGVNANKYGAQYGLTDNDTRGVADEITKRAAERSRTGRQAAILKQFANTSGVNGIRQRLAEAIKSGSVSEAEAKELETIATRLDEDPTSFTATEGNRVEHILTKAGETTYADFDSNTSKSKLAVDRNKELYENVVNSVAQSDHLKEMDSMTAASNKFKTSSAVGAKITGFMLDKSKELQNILEETDFTDKDLVQSKLSALIEDAHSKGEIDDDAYKVMHDDFAKNGEVTMRAAWDAGNFSNEDELNKAKVMKVTMDNSKRDNELERISAKGKELFAGVDKNSFAKLIELVGTDKYKNADDKTRLKMVSEAFGTQLNGQQKEFLAYQMIRTGKMSTGMAYNDRAGNKGYLSDEQITVAQYAMEHPAELLERMRKAGPDGTIKIGDEEYTLDQINEYVAATENAAANAVGMNEEKSTGKLLDTDKDGKAVSTNRFSNITEKSFTEKDIKATQKDNIKALLYRMGNLVTHEGVTNVHYNAVKEAIKNGGNIGEEYDKLADELIKDPTKAKEFGIDDPKKLAELERKAGFNRKKREEYAKRWIKGSGPEQYDLDKEDQELFASDKEGIEAKKKEEEEKNRKIDEKFLVGQDTTNEILSRIEAKL